MRRLQQYIAKDTAHLKLWSTLATDRLVGRLAFCDVAVCDAYENRMDFRGCICDFSGGVVLYKTRLVRTEGVYFMSYRAFCKIVDMELYMYYPERHVMYKNGKFIFYNHP